MLSDALSEVGKMARFGMWWVRFGLVLWCERRGGHGDVVQILAAGSRLRLGVVVLFLKARAEVVTGSSMSDLSTGTRSAPESWAASPRPPRQQAETAGTPPSHLALCCCMSATTLFKFTSSPSLCNEDLSKTMILRAVVMLKLTVEEAALGQLLAGG